MQHICYELVIHRHLNVSVPITTRAAHAVLGKHTCASGGMARKHHPAHRAPGTAFHADPNEMRAISEAVQKTRAPLRLAATREGRDFNPCESRGAGSLPAPLLPSVGQRQGRRGGGRYRLYFISIFTFIDFQQKVTVASKQNKLVISNEKLALGDCYKYDSS